MNLFSPLPVLFLVLLGVAGTFFGLILLGVLKPIIMFIIHKMAALNKSSMTLPLWRDVPIEIYTQIYVFNYTNAEDFLTNATNGGVKPHVQQLGPYTYRQYRQKTILKWNDTDDTVEYVESRRFHFVREMSSGSESDVITLPNLPLMAIVALAPESEAPALQAAIHLTNTTVFVQKTISELIFQGYKDELVDLLQYLTGMELLPGAMFGLMYGKNGSNEGVVKIKRGNNDNREIGKIVSWKNASELTFWNGMPCNSYVGSDGSLHHTDLQKDETITIFSFDLARTLRINYIGESQFRGIDGYRYSIDLKEFADVNMNPDNRCYCPNEVDQCDDSGVMSLGPAKMGAPVYVSQPHFLMTNHKTRFMVSGLDPKPELHRTFIDLEPVSGAPLKIAARLQLNVRVKPLQGIEGIEDLPVIMLPIVWLNERAELTEELASMISFRIGLAMFVANVLPWLSIAGGLAIIALGTAGSFVLLFKEYTSKVSPLIVAEDPYVKATSRGYFNEAYNN